MLALVGIFFRLIENTFISRSLLCEIEGIIGYPLFSHCLDLALLLEQGTHLPFSLADKRHGFQFPLPFLCDKDGVLLNDVIVHRKPDIVCILKHRLYILGMNGVPDIVHIGLAALRSLWKLVREVLCHSRLLEHLGVQRLDPDLVVGWGVAEPDLMHLEKPLLSRQNRLQEVLGDLLIG